MKWTIGKKLVLGFSIVFMLFIIALAFIFTYLQKIEHHAHLIQEYTYPKSELAAQLELSSTEVQRWLTDISATRGISGYDEGFRMAEQSAKTFEDTVDKLVALAPDRKTEIEAVEATFRELYAVGKEMAASYIKGGQEAGNPFMVKFDPLTEDIHSQISALTDTIDKEINATLQEAEDQAANSIRILIASTVLVLIAGIIVSFLFIRSLTGPIQKVRAALDEAAQGNLSMDVQASGSDEIADMVHAMNRMIQAQRNVAEATRQIAVGNLDVEVEIRSEKDELGKSLRKMIDDLKSITEVARKISNGNLTVNLKPRSDKDVLGIALTEMIYNLQEMADVANAISKGDLNVKLKPQSEKDVLGNALKDMVLNLEDMAKIAKRISDGDLSVEVVPRSEKDVFGNALAQMTKNLVQIVSKIKTASETIASSSSQISSGSAELSQRTQEQASAIEETSATIEEMTATIKQNAENATFANQIAKGASDLAAEGGKVVLASVKAMTEVTESSKKIADIVSMVNEIAFQTNLLALNAAVEAARAGEQGKGFAVVASEVRNLAGRSANAARQIQTLIEDSSAKIGETSTSVEASGETLTKIIQEVSKVAETVSEITAASQEQATGIEQVNRAITQMDQVVQHNASLVEESSASAESLASQAGEMARMMAFFFLKDRDVSSVSTEAIKWKAESKAPKKQMIPNKSPRFFQEPDDFFNDDSTPGVTF